MACSDIISHARLFFKFFSDEPQNPWQMLAEPLGSAEPRLKITDLHSMLKVSYPGSLGPSPAISVPFTLEMRVAAQNRQKIH